ncbi:MAG: hypothetical protein IPK07_22460 [Deltaproteobacteria bacterium]|nr:hypothetical protein [Deltaproteobacteria bacterium]
MNRRSWSSACAAFVAVGSLAWIVRASAQEEPPYRPGPGAMDRGGPGGGGPMGGGPMGGGPGGPGGAGDDGANHFFEALDSNKDGAVTEEEVVRFARDRFREAVAGGDSNKDRKLTKTEFQQAARIAHDHPPGQGESLGERSRPPTSGELFRAFDLNHDGKLTAAETPEPHRQNVMGLLARLGKSPDGYLTPKDFDRLSENGGDHPPDGGGPGRPGGGQGPGPGPGGGGPGGGPQGGDERPNPDLVFRIVDRNRDGRVDRAEAEMAPPGPRAGMLSLLNRQGLSSVTKAEFAALVGPMSQAPSPGGPGGNGGPGGPGGPPGPQDDPLKDLDMVFEKCDRNKDGRLTLAELEGTENETLKEIIQKLGKTESGISKAEIRELASHAPRRSGGPGGVPGGSSSTSTPASGTGPR